MASVSCWRWVLLRHVQSKEEGSTYYEATIGCDYPWMPLRYDQGKEEEGIASIFNYNVIVTIW